MIWAPAKWNIKINLQCLLLSVVLILMLPATSWGPEIARRVGDAKTANPLSQFAVTSSAQLAGVLSDETGTAGGFCRATSPVFTTPNIGTATGSVTGNAGTATALAANGANCTAGNYPLGVDQFGAVESCTAAGGGGGSGTVTSLAEGSGIAMTPNPTTDTGTVAWKTPLTTKGDIPAHTGAAYVRVPVGPDGSVLKANSDLANGIGWSRNFNMMGAGDRNWQMCRPSLTSSTSLNGFSGMSATGCAKIDGVGVGSSVAAPALTNAVRNYVTYTSGSTANNCGGFLSQSVTHTRPLYLPAFAAVIHTGAATTDLIQWYGFDPSGLICSLTAADSTASAVNFAAVAYDPDVSANWRCCTGDGTTETCSNITSSTWAANTEYQVTVDITSSTNTRCCVRGIAAGTAALCIDKTTNQPASTTNLGFGAYVRTKVGTQTRTVSANRMYLETN